MYGKIIYYNTTNGYGTIFGNKRFFYFNKSVVSKGTPKEGGSVYFESASPKNYLFASAFNIHVNPGLLSMFTKKHGDVLDTQYYLSMNIDDLLNESFIQFLERLKF